MRINFTGVMENVDFQFDLSAARRTFAELIHLREKNANKGRQRIFWAWKARGKIWETSYNGEDA